MGGARGYFVPVTASEMLAAEAAPITWVWEPFIPDGALVLLTAYAKAGKSTLAYALAVAVAQGRLFLGYPTRQCGVLILAVEEHPRDVRRRLERFGMRPSDPITKHCGLLLPSALDVVRDYIKAHGIGLVLLDTLSRYWNVPDENDAAQVVAAGSPLLDLAHETNVALLALHHDKKRADKRGGENGTNIRGSSAIFALADQALMLSRPQGRGDRLRTLCASGRYDETPDEITLELTDAGYRVVRQPGERRDDATDRRVLEALPDPDDSPQELAAIAAKAGLGEKPTREALVRLGTHVVREGGGVKGDPHRYRRAA